MNPSFRFLMPVRLRSDSSRAAIQSRPSFEVLLSSSRSPSNPSLIRPPSLSATGGSSATALAMSAATSDTSTSLDEKSLNSPVASPSTARLTSGTAARHSLMATRSLALALPYMTFAVSLSRSRILSMESARSPLTTVLATSSPTASSRRRTASMSMSGSESHFFSSLEPMGVSVWSSTDASVNSCPPSLTFLTTSRFLRVVWSSTSLSDEE